MLKFNTFLTNFLLESGINSSNIKNIANYFGTSSDWIISNYEINEYIKTLENLEEVANREGSLFTIKCDDNSVIIVIASMSENQIRKLIKLKAFL